MKNDKIGIIFLGTIGFPYGSATIQRQVQLGKSLLEVGFRVIVINRRSLHSKSISKRENISSHGYYEGIKYFYSSIVPYRPINFIVRNFFKFFGIIAESFIIIYLRFFKNVKYILYRENKLINSKYYYLISKFLRMQIIYDYVEFYDSLGKRENSKVNDLKISFDYEFYHYCDKIIVISDFLDKHVKKIVPNKPRIKIPPTIDFSYFDNVTVSASTTPFFLFCGSASYNDIIRFIIKAFINSKAIEQNYELKLIINGDKYQLETLNYYIEETKCEKSIKVLSKLSYLDLVSYYKSSEALLIPLSNNVQDQARFPFKICEYSASKRPIITSNSGAIKEFFTDNINAIIARVNDDDDFTSKLDLVINKPKFANEIGLNSYELGKKVFNYKSYSEDLKDFIVNANDLRN